MAVEQALCGRRGPRRCLGRTRVRIATDSARQLPGAEKVPERLARNRDLPLAVSESPLDIATANPYDLDCEKILRFATRRTVRMCSPRTPYPGTD